MSFRTLAALLAALALVALALRVTRLGERPPHTDEAVNAWILGQVLAGQPFAFDVRDRHGPLLPAAEMIVARASGRHSFAELDEGTLRLTPAIVGAAATGLFFLGKGLVPNAVLLTSAALWAISPIPLYYARYAIHETLLVAATLALLLSLLRLAHAVSRGAGLGWAIVAGLAAGAMVASKLSALMPLAAAACAVAVAWYTRRKGDRSGTTPISPLVSYNLRHALACALVLASTAAVVIIVGYTWGFTRWAGLHDLIFGGEAALARASGQGHEKGPTYLLSVLGFGGAGFVLFLAAATGAVIAWRRGGALGRALVTYAVVLIGLHTAVPYKTPWLTLGLWLPLAALAGWFVDALVSWARRRARPAHIAVALILGAGTTATAVTSRDLVFTQPAGENNPLAYAHTSPDLLRIQELIATLPAKEPLIAVYLEDPWPLPFLLRRQSQVGYWQPGQAVSENPDLLITTPELAETLGADFAQWRPHFFTQRPGVMLVALQSPAQEAAPSP